MEQFKTAIPDVKILVPRRFSDARGYFTETFNRRELGRAGIDVDFVQDNQSLSVERGVIRGLHYQLPPVAQCKLIRVLSGAIRDIAVDIRSESPTFGRHVAVDLTADDGRQVFVPAGFAHGFATLEPNTIVQYKVSDYYSPSHERGIRWDDPALAIDWGIGAEDAILSDRDRAHPLLSGLSGRAGENLGSRRERVLIGAD